jgi:hypothetical protein
MLGRVDEGMKAINDKELRIMFMSLRDKLQSLSNVFLHEKELDKDNYEELFEQLRECEDDAHDILIKAQDCIK